MERRCRRMKPIHLVNRAMSGFPPGSTFKLVTSLAGLRGAKVLAKHAVTTCTGGVQLLLTTISNAGNILGTAHLGWLMRSKYRVTPSSINTAMQLGFSRLTTLARCWVLAKQSGLQLSPANRSAIMPGPEWMQINHPQERWSQAQTANVCIGQGYTLVSPLQLAMA